MIQDKLHLGGRSLRWIVLSGLAAVVVGAVLALLVGGSVVRAQEAVFVQRDGHYPQYIFTYDLRWPDGSSKRVQIRASTRGDADWHAGEMARETPSPRQPEPKGAGSPKGDGPSKPEKPGRDCHGPAKNCLG